MELHFWMMEVFYEAQYSYSRNMLTRIYKVASLLDDLYDSCCSTEDGEAFLTALVRYVMNFINLYDNCCLSFLLLTL